MRALAVGLAVILSFSFTNDARADDGAYTRAQAITAGLLSAGLSLPPIALQGIKHTRGVRYGLELGSTTPAFVVDAADESGAMGFAAVETSLVGASYGTLLAQLHHGEITPYFRMFDEAAVETALYGSWVAYRDARAHGSSPAWNDKWRPWTAGELIVAPFQPKHLARPIVVVPAGAVVAVLGSGAIVSVATGNAPRHAVRDAALGLPLGLDAGVAEESMFRGFFYEELQLSLGRWPARAIDLTLFTCFHIPAQMIGQKPTTVIFAAATKVVGGLVMETAYDEGGLPESVATHALWDMSIFLFQPFVKGLAPTQQKVSTSAHDLVVTAPVVSGSF